MVEHYLQKKMYLSGGRRGLSYGAIARDIMGCPEWEVAAIIKIPNSQTVLWIKKKSY